MDCMQELERINLIPNKISVAEEILNERLATAFSALRKAYLKLCLIIHPDKDGSSNVGLATRCTQKISNCFELAKEYATEHHEDPKVSESQCVIPVNLLFNGYNEKDYEDEIVDV
ncbi:unnamed protein product [Agarophyton chilense]